MPRVKDFLAQHTKRWWALYHKITPAEAAIEPCIAGLGVPYRFQYPILGFFADFALPAQKVIIEVDGSQHSTKRGAANDAKRTAKLVKHGWQVYRVTNETALSDPQGWVRTHIAPLFKD